MKPTRPSQRLVAGLGFAGLLLYAIWIGWPYLESIVIRDAAVTTWISTAPSPISGYVTNELYPGSRVGADGRLATIHETQADERDLARARADFIRAEGDVAVQTALVGGMRRALGGREAHATGFAETLAKDIDVAVEGSQSAVTSIQHRLDLARSESERLAKLQRDGVASQSTVDASRAAVSDLEQRLTDAQSSLSRATQRRSAAASDVFVNEGATDANETFHNLAEARVRLVQAEESLIQLRAERDATKLIADAAQKAYEKSQSLDIHVPPRAMVWSLIAGPGAPVQPGSPVASWIDCRVMLVDVPLSDVETALLRPDSPADVVLEGERKSRRGVVILTRGSAGTLGNQDLAAIAKGRRPGLGQAIVKLEPTPADVESCRVGHAAHVDFPEVGAIDVIRARLRW